MRSWCSMCFPQASRRLTLVRCRHSQTSGREVQASYHRCPCTRTRPRPRTQTHTHTTHTLTHPTLTLSTSPLPPRDWARTRAHRPRHVPGSPPLRRRSAPRPTCARPSSPRPRGHRHQHQYAAPPRSRTESIVSLNTKIPSSSPKRLRSFAGCYSMT